VTEYEKACALEGTARSLQVQGAPEKVTYIACPECNNIMNRKIFAQISGIIVDECKAHGTWLDRSELQRILVFVRERGLVRAKEFEEERKSAEARKLRVDMRTAAIEASMHSDLGSEGSLRFLVTLLED